MKEGKASAIPAVTEKSTWSLAIAGTAVILALIISLSMSMTWATASTKSTEGEGDDIEVEENQISVSPHAISIRNDDIAESITGSPNFTVSEPKTSSDRSELERQASPQTADLVEMMGKIDARLDFARFLMLMIAGIAIARALSPSKVAILRHAPIAALAAIAGITMLVSLSPIGDLGEAMEDFFELGDRSGVDDEMYGGYSGEMDGTFTAVRDVEISWGPSLMLIFVIIISLGVLALAGAEILAWAMTKEAEEAGLDESQTLAHKYAPHTLIGLVSVIAGLLFATQIMPWFTFEQTHNADFGTGSDEDIQQGSFKWSAGLWRGSETNDSFYADRNLSATTEPLERGPGGPMPLVTSAIDGYRWTTLALLGLSLLTIGILAVGLTPERVRERRIGIGTALLLAISIPFTLGAAEGEMAEAWISDSSRITIDGGPSSSGIFNTGLDSHQISFAFGPEIGFVLLESSSHAGFGITAISMATGFAWILLLSIMALLLAGGSSDGPASLQGWVISQRARARAWGIPLLLFCSIMFGISAASEFRIEGLGRGVDIYHDHIVQSVDQDLLVLSNESVKGAWQTSSIEISSAEMLEHQSVESGTTSELADVLDDLTFWKGIITVLCMILAGLWIVSLVSAPSSTGKQALPFMLVCILLSLASAMWIMAQGDISEAFLDDNKITNDDGVDINRGRWGHVRGEGLSVPWEVGPAFWYAVAMIGIAIIVALSHGAELNTKLRETPAHMPWTFDGSLTEGAQLHDRISIAEDREALLATALAGMACFGLLMASMTAWYVRTDTVPIQRPESYEGEHFSNATWTWKAGLWGLSFTNSSFENWDNGNGTIESTTVKSGNGSEVGIPNVDRLMSTLRTPIITGIIVAGTGAVLIYGQSREKMGNLLGDRRGLWIIVFASLMLIIEFGLVDTSEHLSNAVTKDGTPVASGELSGFNEQVIGDQGRIIDAGFIQSDPFHSTSGDVAAIEWGYGWAYSGVNFARLCTWLGMTASLTALAAASSTEKRWLDLKSWKGPAPISILSVCVVFGIIGAGTGNFVAKDVLGITEGIDGDDGMNAYRVSFDTLQTSVDDSENLANDQELSITFTPSSEGIGNITAVSISIDCAEQQQGFPQEDEDEIEVTITPPQGYARSLATHVASRTLAMSECPLQIEYELEKDKDPREGDRNARASSKEKAAAGFTVDLFDAPWQVKAKAIAKGDGAINGLGADDQTGVSLQINAIGYTVVAERIADDAEGAN